MAIDVVAHPVPARYLAKSTGEWGEYMLTWHMKVSTYLPLLVTKPKTAAKMDSKAIEANIPAAQPSSYPTHTSRNKNHPPSPPNTDPSPSYNPLSPATYHNLPDTDGFPHRSSDSNSDPL